MACYHPQKLLRSNIINKETGKRSLVQSPKNALSHMHITVPCGQCIGCRLEKSRQWAIRCVHESKLHKKNCFITLTYDNEHLPKGDSLEKKDFVLFMKNLRKKYGRVRYFHCGEYGETCQICRNNRKKCTCDKFIKSLGRPHHHACLFGIDFEDKTKMKDREGKIDLYTSESLLNIWKKGHVTIGQVNFETAAYVARYVTKKITGELAESHYQGKQPEYVTMSRMPGIGSKFLDSYIDEIYNNDEIIIRGGVKCKPPRYYDKLYQKKGGDLRKLQETRNAKLKATDYDQLNVSEYLAKKQFKQFTRELDVT